MPLPSIKTIGIIQSIKCGGTGTLQTKSMRNINMKSTKNIGSYRTSIRKISESANNINARTNRSPLINDNKTKKIVSFAQNFTTDNTTSNTSKRDMIQQSKEQKSAIDEKFRLEQAPSYRKIPILTNTGSKKAIGGTVQSLSSGHHISSDGIFEIDKDDENFSATSLDDMTNHISKQEKAKKLKEDLVSYHPDKNLIENFFSESKVDLSQCVRVSLECGQDKLQLSTEYEQVIDCKLTVEEYGYDYITRNLPSEKKMPKPSLDLLICIDNSASMGLDEKLSTAKVSLIKILEKLKPEDRVSIITFNTIAKYILAPKMVGFNKREIIDSLLKIKPMGGTNMQQALDKVIEVISQRQTKNDLTAVLFMSDGIDNENIDRKFNSYFDIVDNEISDEFIIHTFGYGEDHDAETLANIALRRNGNYYYVEDMSKFDETLDKCISSLNNIICKNAIIDLTLNPDDLIFPGLSFEKTYGAKWIGDKVLQRTINIQNFFKDYKKEFLFQLRLNRCIIGQRPDSQRLRRMHLLDVVMKVKGFYGKVDSYEIYDFFKPIVCDEDEMCDIFYNENIKKSMIRVRGAEIMKDAIKLYNKNGNIYSQKILENFINDEIICQGFENDVCLSKLKDNMEIQIQILEDERKFFQVDSIYGYSIFKATTLGMNVPFIDMDEKMETNKELCNEKHTKFQTLTRRLQGL